MEHRYRVRVGALELDPVTMEEAVEQLLQMVKTPQPRARMVVTVNAQFVCIAKDERRFSDLIREADLAVADGVSVIAASHLLGHPLPGRVNGTDLLVQLCKEAAKNELSVYFLGGRPGTALKTASNLCRQFPQLKVDGIDCPPLGFESNPVESKAVEQRISAVAPDLLFVGLGAPKQEYWMKKYSRALPVKVMIGVGGSFELLSGELPRAPLWMQHIGLEWAFRLGVEPRRLWKRYLVGNLEFIQIVFWQWLTQRKWA